MNLSPIGYNINGQAVRDLPRLTYHLQRLNPAWLLVMDNLALAQQIKAMLPRCNVIYRAWPDDGVPTEAPEDWVARRATFIGGADIWAYTSNEPPATPALWDWHARAMDAARKHGLKLVVGNFAAGQPQPDRWAQGRAVLDRLAAHPDQFVLGLHEYACGFAISGAPNFEALIPTDRWPVNPRALGHLYHCGRFHFLLDYCRAQNLRPPRIVMTEAGFDDLQDVAAWRDTLRVTPPYPGIRGWKTLPDQWRAWWPGWGAQRAYAEQTTYLWRALYADTPVEALLLFTWSASAQWEQFDVSEAGELQSALEAHTMIVADINPGVDDPRWRPYMATSAPAGTIVRQNPTTASVPVTTLKGDVAVQHIPFEDLTAAEQLRARPDTHVWLAIKVDATQQVGWARGDVLTLTPLALEPAPEPEPEPPAPEPEPPTGDYVTRAEYNALLEKYRELQAAIVRLEADTVTLVAREIRVNEDALLTAMARAMVALIDERGASKTVKAA